MSHWYDYNGFLLPQVEYSDPKRKGFYREPTLGDARKVNALPSVTTILQLLAKPGLVRWQVEQGIKAVYNDYLLEAVLRNPNEEVDVPRYYYKSQEYVNWTADFGTACHFWLNKKLRAAETIEIPPMVPGSEEVADGVLDWMASHEYSFSLTEHRFARRDLGYAGTIDLVGTHSGHPCIVDLKTQSEPLTPYIEHALQLSGYDYALPLACECGHFNTDHGETIIVDGEILNRCTKDDWCPSVRGTNRERISLIANRDKPGEVKEHIWVDKGSTVEATNARFDKIWLTLVDLWMLLSSYDPRKESALVNLEPQD